MGVSGCDTHNGSAATVVDIILPRLLNPVQLLFFMFSCQDLTQAHDILAEMGCASREGREDCLGHGGIGAGGRKEQLTEPQDVNLHSCDCTVTCSFRSPANSSLNLKTAQADRCKDLPDDCYPNIGHEVVGNPRGNQFILEK